MLINTSHRCNVFSINFYFSVATKAGMKYVPQRGLRRFKSYCLSVRCENNHEQNSYNSITARRPLEKLLRHGSFERARGDREALVAKCTAPTLSNKIKHDVTAVSGVAIKFVQTTSAHRKSLNRCISLAKGSKLTKATKDRTYPARSGRISPIKFVLPSQGTIEKLPSPSRLFHRSVTTSF